jgi:hypothetical protein
MKPRRFGRDRDSRPASLPAPSSATLSPGLAAVMQDAAHDSASPLDRGVRAGLESRLGHDFSRVRVHSGPASAEAARRIGARAYTLGSDIHLGLEGAALSGRERARLLAHEAVHTAQQGGRSAAPRAGLAVASVREPEAEAHGLADEVAAAPAPAGPRSRSLALRDRLLGGALTPVGVPMVQPHLKKSLGVADGTFDLDLTTESHAGAKSGMSGTIKFTASASSPDSTSIRLVQIAKLVDLSTGKDYPWTGGEANRNKVMTKEDTTAGVEGGYFTDVVHATRKPRTAAGDAAVSPYYIDDYKSIGDPRNADGSKAGKTIKSASLWDYPGWSKSSRFSFETAAKAADTGYIYATVQWGFTISDGAKGKVDTEHAAALLVPSATFRAAQKEFDKFYRNPGSPTAP